MIRHVTQPVDNRLLSVQCYAWTEYKFTCVCVCVSVCVRHTFCQLAYGSDPTTDFFIVDSLNDADLRKDVSFGVWMMNNHI